MPKYAFLQSSFLCPTCEAPIADVDVVKFQWGYCRAATPWEDFIYRIHDKLKWKVCKEGNIPPWTYFEDSRYPSPNDLGGANIGAPSINYVVAKDPSFYFSNLSCQSCKQQISGSAVEITDGVITRAWLLRPGELTDASSYYSTKPDDPLSPVLEWDNHAMDLIVECE